jgi:hypothetical protein
MIFDLFHGGRLEIGGQVIQLASPVLPVPVRRDDHILWTFPEPVRVSTPGPDQYVAELMQYRNRIEFIVPFWIHIVLEFVDG